jgi:transposase
MINKLEEIIYDEAISYKEIVKILKQNFNIKISENTVWRRAKELGIKRKVGRKKIKF